MSIVTATRALAAAVLAAFVAAGCDALPDEQLLRFLGFETTSGSSTVQVSVLEVGLDGTSDDLVAGLENTTFTVGRSEDSGTGILVERVHVAYSIAGAPAYEYQATLYLAAPAKAGETSKGKLGVILAPASFKQWLSASGYGPGAQFNARVTFFARTDDGNELETSGGITVLVKA